jgi:hypothetical protein
VSAALLILRLFGTGDQTLTFLSFVFRSEFWHILKHIYALFPGGTLSFNSGIFPLERNIFLLSFLRSVGMKQLEAAKGD